MTTEKKYCDLRSAKHQLDSVQSENPANKDTWHAVLTEVVEDMDVCELLPVGKCDLNIIKQDMRDVLKEAYSLDEFKTAVSNAIDEFEECGQYYGNLGTGSKKKRSPPSLRPLNKWHKFLKPCMDDPKIKFDKSGKQRHSRDMLKACGVRYTAQKYD